MVSSTIAGKQHWVDLECPEDHPLLGALTRDGGSSVWTCEWKESVVQYLANHRVRDTPLVPGSCFLEMVSSAVAQMHGDVPFELRDVLFKEKLFLDTEARPKLRLRVEPLLGEGAGQNELKAIVESSDGLGSWTEHVSMSLRVGIHSERQSEFDIEGAKRRCSEMRSGDGFYQTVGNLYSGDFLSLQTVWRGSKESLGLIELKSGGVSSAPLQLCALLDCATHVGLEWMELIDLSSGIYVSSLGLFYVPGSRRERDTVFWSHLEAQGERGDFRISVYDVKGRLQARFEKLLMQNWANSDGVLVSVDERVSNIIVPRLDSTAEVIRTRSALELHSSVMTRFDTLVPLCVIARDEEFDAYLQTLQTQCPALGGWCSVS